MKKSPVNKILIVLAVVCAISLGAFFALKDTEANKPQVEETTIPPYATVTDPAGNVYVAVADANGVTYAAIQDSNGDVWQVSLNADGSLGETVGSLNNTPGLENIFTTAAQTTQATVVTANRDEYTGQAQEITTQAEETTKKSDKSKDKTDKKDKDSESTTKKKKDKDELNVIRYKNMLNSSNYYIEFTTDDETLGDTPIVSAKYNGDIVFNTVLEGMSATVLVKSAEGKAYAIIDQWKVYATLPKSIFEDEDMSMSDLDLIGTYFNKDFKPELAKVSQVELNGKTLTKESFKTAKGTIFDYYFDGDNLARIDTISSDGTVSSMYITKFSTDVDPGLFEIPQKYRHINLGWL